MYNFFSIITVCYNSSNTIERTIKSVFGQTCQDYEFIIIDGASKDNTLDIVKHYEPLFKGRMKWISEPDTGIYNAMNKGIKMATGELIGIVNSDDWLELTALESIKKLAANREDRSKAFFCGSLYFHYDNGMNQILYADKDRFEKGIKKHSHGYGLYHPSTFIGRGVYETVGLYDESLRVAADADFIYRCYNSSVKFYFTKDIISNMSDGGVSNSPDYKKFIKENTKRLKQINKKRLYIIYSNTRGCIKMAIKRLLPTFMLVKYRNYKQKSLVFPKKNNK